jgi:hypothetical protein
MRISGVNLYDETGTIVGYVEAADATKPSPEVVAKLRYEDFSGIEQSAIDAYFEENPENKPEILTNVGFQPNWETDLALALKGGYAAIYAADGTKLQLTPDVISKVNANSIWAEGFDPVTKKPKLDIILVPTLGSPESTKQAEEGYTESPPSVLPPVFVPSTKGEVNTTVTQANKAQALQDAGDLEGAATAAADALQRLQSLNAEDFANMSDYVANAIVALSSGNLSEEDAKEAEEQINLIVDLLTYADQYMNKGNKISAGVAEGMNDYNWQTDANTLAASMQNALDVALQINSPSKLVKPEGQGVAEGIAEGMKETSSVSSAAGFLATAIFLMFNTLRARATSSGANVGQGLIDGMQSKLSDVIAKAAELAREAINSINTTAENGSPSKATRRSGRFLGDGYVLGIEDRITNARRASAKLARAGLPSIDVNSVRLATTTSSSLGPTVTVEPVDYNQLADAIAQRPANLIAKSRVMATTLASENTTAMEARRRRIAQGYGGK